jgi:hypothetical protein
MAIGLGNIIFKCTCKEASGYILLQPLTIGRQLTDAMCRIMSSGWRGEAKAKERELWWSCGNYRKPCIKGFMLFWGASLEKYEEVIPQDRRGSHSPWEKSSILCIYLMQQMDQIQTKLCVSLKTAIARSVNHTALRWTRMGAARNSKSTR